MNDELIKAIELINSITDKEMQNRVKKALWKPIPKKAGRPRITRKDIGEAIHAYFKNNKCATKASKTIVNQPKSKAKAVEVLGITRSSLEIRLARFFPEWQKLFKVRGFDDLYWSACRTVKGLEETDDPLEIYDIYMAFFTDMEQQAKTGRQRRQARQSKKMISHLYIVCILNMQGLINEAEFLQEMKWLDGQMNIINHQKVDQQIKEMTDTILSTS